ncbi:MAG TPA: hypothetical protein VK968_02015, partial [Roseimicrobium sp.]|nr:hypothetical protein [Roseimicrobium sp.]
KRPQDRPGSMEQLSRALRAHTVGRNGSGPDIILSSVTNPGRLLQPGNRGTSVGGLGLVAARGMAIPRSLRWLGLAVLFIAVAGLWGMLAQQAGQNAPTDIATPAEVRHPGGVGQNPASAKPQVQEVEVSKPQYPTPAISPPAVAIATPASVPVLPAPVVNRESAPAYIAPPPATQRSRPVSLFDDPDPGEQVPPPASAGQKTTLNSVSDVLTLEDSARLAAIASEAGGKVYEFRGKVTNCGTSRNGKVFQIFFHTNGEAPFVCVYFPKLYSEMQRRHGGESGVGLLGKNVAVRGVVTVYRGIPQIVIDDPDQLLAAGPGSAAP